MINKNVDEEYKRGAKEWYENTMRNSAEKQSMLNKNSLYRRRV